MLYELASAGVEIRRYYFERDAAHFLTTEISLKLAATLGIGLGGFEENGLTKMLAFRRLLVLVLGIAAFLTRPTSQLPVLVAMVNVCSMPVYRSRY